MKGKWNDVRLGEIAEQGEYGFVDGPFGSNLPASSYQNTGVPVIRGSNLSLGEVRFKDHEFVYVSEETGARLRRSCCKPEDIVFTKKGTIGQTGFVPLRGKYDRYLLSSNQMKLAVNRKIADPLFVYYYVSSPQSREKILQDSSSTGVPKINLTYLRQFPIRLPSIAEQKAIAHILGTLDDKIELNGRTNKTLESMARAIFKSWFVDFDPVRAKMDDRQPEGMGAATAKLFPDGFEESELGPIPRGWQAATIKSRTSEIQYGLTQSATSEPVGPKFLRITDIRGGKINWPTVPFCELTDSDLEKYRIDDGDIFVARTGASTGENIRVIDPPHSVFASYLVRFRFSKPAVSRIVGEFMRTPVYADYVAGCIGGSAQPNASAQLLAGATLVFPTEEIAMHFFDAIDPIDRTCAANARESSTLAELRKTLLPKLLSGENLLQRLGAMNYANRRS